MDKSWIDLPNRMSQQYWDGIEQFLNFACANLNEDLTISCPCRICYNRYSFPREIVRAHLIRNGFLKKYKQWTRHGESYVSLPTVLENITVTSDRDDIVGMVEKAIGIRYEHSDDDQELDTSYIQSPPLFVHSNVHYEESTTYDSQFRSTDQTADFFQLLEDARSELYPGCTSFTKLSFVVRLLQIKVLNGWSDKSFTMLLKLLNEAFPEGVKLPTSYYHAQKITTDLGFTYNTWDACPNNCMLFKGDDRIHLDKCIICGASRYKQDSCIQSQVTQNINKVAGKRVRHFPLKPRLQRLFISSKTAKLMRWHSEERIKDGILRHPADSPAWEDFDKRHLLFSSETRNVRLGLASDGFNPFRTMNISHSTWPVLLIPYNLPPWMCMNHEYIASFALHPNMACGVEF